MKKLFILGTVVVSTFSYSQVGIGTGTPHASLEIVASGNNNNADGLLIPRLTRGQLTDKGNSLYAEDQVGTMIYVSDVSQGDATLSRINIISTGFYFFDGTFWQKVNNQSNTYTGSSSITLNGNSFERNALTGDVVANANSNATTISNNAVTTTKLADNSVNSDKIINGTIANDDLNTGVGGLYKGNGSLNGATTVTQGANQLAFTATAVNGFSVDGTTLSVDAANNRIGIGTAAPTQALHVQGKIRMVDGTQGTGRVLTSDGSGNATWTPFIDATPPTVLGVNTPVNRTGLGNGASAYVYSGLYVELTPGKWIVNLGLTLKGRGGDRWLHAYLSNSTSLSTLTRQNWSHLGPAGNNTSYAGIIRNADDIRGEFSFLTGSIVVQVLVSVRLYVMLENNLYSGLSYEHNSGNFENFLYAIPTN